MRFCRNGGTNEVRGPKGPWGLPAWTPGTHRRLVLSQLSPVPLATGMTPIWDPFRLILVLSASSIPPKPNPARPGLPEEHGGLHPHPKVLSGDVAWRKTSLPAPPATRAAQGGERGVSMGWLLGQENGNLLIQQPAIAAHLLQ